ncbi:MAG: restriction endonuclease subunit S [Candidatus Riflebacteria bacterium]|nr:restriction endonuclease subunit S [Candidatus Riflebacteria bacterium]
MKIEKFIDFTDVIAGQSPPSNSYNHIGDGLPFFQGMADFGEKYPIVRSWCTSDKRKIALPKDILMSVRAPVGPVNICKEKSIIGRGLFSIRSRKTLYFLYLFYYLKAHERQISNFGSGSTFKAITQKDFRRISISIPGNFGDQIRIAKVLERVEGLIGRRKESLRLLDEFLKSTFLEMFGDPIRNDKGWEKSFISDVSESRLGKMRDKKFISGKHLRPYLGNSNVRWFSIGFRTIGNGF